MLDHIESGQNNPIDVMYTVARAREGVRNTSGITQKRQARGGAHLGLHHNRREPQEGDITLPM